MRIVRFSFCPYELPLAKPWHTSRGIITARYGCLIAFHSSRGEVGLGDLAPLNIPTMETSAAIMQILERLRSNVRWPRLTKELNLLDAWLAELHLHPERFPDLNFALQCALAGLISTRMRKPLHKLLKPMAPMMVPVNAVISGEGRSEVLAAAEQAIASEYKTLKVKIGSRSVAEDLSLLADLRTQYRDVKLRADANGAWVVRDAVKFCRTAFPLNIEYVEDPLRSPTLASLRNLQRREFTPIALDDAALMNDELMKAPAVPFWKVHVVKPARYGSLSAIQQLSERAKVNQTSIVITGALESSIGLSYVAACAAAFGDLKYAQGLATAQWLAEDTLSLPVVPRHGMLPIPYAWELPKLLRPQYQDELGIDV